jgi:hypothetical protein
MRESPRIPASHDGASCRLTQGARTGVARRPSTGESAESIDSYASGNVPAQVRILNTTRILVPVEGDVDIDAHPETVAQPARIKSGADSLITLPAAAF